MPQVEPAHRPAIDPAPSGQRGLDGLLVLVTLVTNVGGVFAVAAHNHTVASTSVPGVLLLLAGPGLLWWRRRRPALVLAGCVLVTWTYLLGGFPDGPVYGPMIVALVSALMHGARAAAYAVVAGTVLARLGAAAVLPGIDSPSWASATGLAAWLAFLLVLGELLRHRRALAESRQKRLLMAIEARADQARREAVEQRLRLASDLHDVLGHQLSVINIQANAGLQLHASGRDGVADALRTVQEASRNALDDVQALLDNLHGPEEHPAHGPSPSLGEPESLVSAARAAGLDVRVEVSGTPQLAAPHDLAASRMVLESLTNVLKHAGPVPTRVRIDHGPNLLSVRVDNAAPRRPPPARASGGGRGIAGMRARLEVLGGTLEAGPADGFAWSVRAELPLRRSARDPRPAGR